MISMMLIYADKGLLSSRWWFQIFFIFIPTWQTKKTQVSSMLMKRLLPVVVCCVWMGCSADLAEKGWGWYRERLQNEERKQHGNDSLALIRRVNLWYIYLEWVFYCFSIRMDFIDRFNLYGLIKGLFITIVPQKSLYRKALFLGGFIV